MKKAPLIIGILIILLGIVLGYLLFSYNKNKASMISIDLLWEKTLHRMLKDHLWQERDAYDAGHFLMVPLHIAFASQNYSYKKDFSTFFENFQKKYPTSEFSKLNNLDKLHFLYLTSQYLVLGKVYDEAEFEELTDIVKNELKNIWEQPAWQWDRDTFEGGMAERIEWKIENKDVSRSYYRAIIDEELFTFAIAADLKFISQNEPFIDEIVGKAYKTFKQEVVFLDGSDRWFLQPGIWRDHPDYAYSGYGEIKPNLEKNPVPGISYDSSHFHRFPLWLISLERAYVEKEPEKAQFFKKLQKGLADQFFEKVLVPPSDGFSNYRTNNFMNGYNGIYRYGYTTQGEGRGYGPYELSGTMLIGWWSFLPEESIGDVYCYISSRFPLSEQEIKVYLGPDTTRDRHPLIKGRAQFEEGLLELISRLICEFRYEEY